jgi:hypothetical protein
LFDIVVKTFSITLHFLDNELQLIFLTLLFLSQSLKVLLFYFVLPVSISHLILHFFNFLSLVLALFIMLPPFLFPSILYILDELSVFLLNSHYFFMKSLDSQVQSLVFDRQLRQLLVKKTYIGLILACHQFFLRLYLMERLMKVLKFVFIHLRGLLYTFLKVLNSGVSLFEPVIHLVLQALKFALFTLDHFVLLL